MLRNGSTKIRPGFRAKSLLPSALVWFENHVLGHGVSTSAGASFPLMQLADMVAFSIDRTLKLTSKVEPQFSTVRAWCNEVRATESRQEVVQCFLVCQIDDG